MSSQDAIELKLTRYLVEAISFPYSYPGALSGNFVYFEWMIYLCVGHNGPG